MRMIRGEAGHTLRMLIAESALTHISQFNCPFRARIHEPVAAYGVELSSSNDLCELLHIGWFDVHYIKALVLDVEVPQVDPEIITANECLAVTVNRYAIDVVCMSIGIRPSRYRGNHCVVVGHPWHFQLGSIAKDSVVRPRGTASAGTSGSKLV